MSINSIASSIFTGAPTDKIEVKDVYSIDSNVLENELDSYSDGLDLSLLESVRKDPKLAVDFSNFLKPLVSGKFNLNKNQMISRILSLIKSSKINFNSLSSDLQNELLNSNSLSALNFNNLSVNIDGTDNLISCDNVSETIDMLSITTSYLGISSNIQTTDIGAETALMSNIFSYVSTLKIPGLMDTLISSSDNTESLNQSLKNCVPDVIQQNDLDSLNSIINKIGAEEVLTADPNAVQNILSSYTLDSTTTADEYQKLYNQLTGTLDSLNPNWNTIERNGETITDLTSLDGISDDAKTILSINSDYQTMFLINDDFSTSDMTLSAQSIYPFTFI